VTHPLSDRRAWRETPAGQLHQALGVADEPDRAVVDAAVEAVRELYRHRFRRELSEAEAASVRLGAELRSAPPALREAPRTVPEIVELVNSRNVGAGWYWAPSRPPGAGIAMRGPDGRWSGDADVVRAAREGEHEMAAARERAAAAWANRPAMYPGGSAGVAGPS
jgi:hypothetical protein